MKYEVQFLGFSKDKIKTMRKKFKTAKSRENFISKGFESGKIYEILAYSETDFSY